MAFSKELLPVGSRLDGKNERPKAVCEYLIERMLKAGADRICFVISPGKSDILAYFGGRIEQAALCYVVQPRPAGLCDALFRPLPFIPPDEPVLVGLPDTIWFPEDGFTHLPDHPLSFLLFPVAHPGLFDAVIADESGRVSEVRVKSTEAGTPWIWGGFRLLGSTLKELHGLWLRRNRSDAYLGTLINAYLTAGGTARAVRAGEAYVDVGTLNGYREALQLLEERRHAEVRESGKPPQKPIAAGRGGGTETSQRKEVHG